MKQLHNSVRFTIFGGILAVGGLLFNTVAFAQNSDIEGTWRLVSRELPDGKKLAPPEVMGLATWMNGQRNLNVVWRTPDGKVASYSLMSTVSVTSSEWSETLQFSLLNDPSNGKGPIVNTSGETKAMPIKRDGGRFQVKLPFDAPAIVIDGDKLIATAEGMFVDYWERVK